MVIDAHLHLWDVARHRYEWLQRPENSAIRRTFGSADFAARAAAAGVDRGVLVQADDDSADTEAMFAVGAVSGAAHGARPPGPPAARPRSSCSAPAG